MQTGGPLGAACFRLSGAAHADRLFSCGGGGPLGPPISSAFSAAVRLQPVRPLSGPCQAIASRRFQRIEDQSETPIRAAPPRPVITSGIWTSDCRYMITERIRIA